jgi:hypothetical protein
MKRLVLLLWLAGLFARPAQADPSVTVKASAGLGGWCRPGRWTPVRVDVETRGETSAAAAAGEIVVEWGDARVRRAMTLASPSHKQVELYIRTADARDSITVRVLVADREMATTVTPVRLVAPAEPLTVCVAPLKTWPASGVTCAATINPDSLPRSWRGYAGADDVVWPPGGKPTLTAEQHTALDRWRVVQAIENAESTVPSAADVTPATHALRRTSTAMLVYAAALGSLVWPLNRVRSRSLAVYPVIAAAVAAGSIVAIAAGRIGPGARVHVSQSAVVEQVAGTKGSSVLARAVAEFPAFGPTELRADGVDGAIVLRGGARRDLRFDENGAPIVAGTYGLGATAAFEVEATTPFEALSATFSGASVRVTNISTREMRDCRFGSGFSRQSVGRLASGQHVEAVRQGPEIEPVFSCKLDAAVVEFAESGRPVDNDGTAAIVLHLREPRADP